MKILYYTFILKVFFCNPIYSQVSIIKIPLLKNYGLGNLSGGLNHINLLTPAPSNLIIPQDISENIIKRYSIQKEQLLYEELKQNVINQLEFEKALLRIGKPEYRQLSFNHFIDILLGTDKIGRRILIIDRNRDLNFINDDIIYTKVDENYKTELEFQFFANNRIFEKKVFIEFTFANKNVKYGTEIENKYFILIGLNEHKNGKFTYVETDFFVELNNTFVFGTYKKTLVQSLISDSKNQHKRSYKIGDIYKTKNQYFKLDSISIEGDTLYLKVLPNMIDLIGFREGWIAPKITAKDTFNNIINVNYTKNKYTLIDFWASWCKPCREKTPHLKELYKSLKPKGVSIYVVSLDDEHISWINAIKKDKIEWKTISDLKGWESKIVKDFNIESIPLYILIDENGRIVLRETNFETLKIEIRKIIN